MGLMRDFAHSAYSYVFVFCYNEIPHSVLETNPYRDETCMSTLIKLSLVTN